LTVGLVPELIVGDLDSLSPEIVSDMKTAGVKIHQYPTDKDQTDLELALDLAIAEQPQEIAVVTALGGRLDQTLGNIFLLARPSYDPVRLKLIDGIQQAVIVRDFQTETIEGQAGDSLSLIPLTPKVDRVSLNGVRWPLDKATLSLGCTRSISNVLTGRRATVEIGAGRLLLVYYDQRFEEALRE